MNDREKAVCSARESRIYHEIDGMLEAVKDKDMPLHTAVNEAHYKLRHSGIHAIVELDRAWNQTLTLHTKIGTILKLRKIIPTLKGHDKAKCTKTLKTVENIKGDWVEIAHYGESPQIRPAQNDILETTLTLLDTEIQQHKIDLRVKDSLRHVSKHDAIIRCRVPGGAKNVFSHDMNHFEKYVLHQFTRNSYRGLHHIYIMPKKTLKLACQLFSKLIWPGHGKIVFTDADFDRALKRLEDIGAMKKPFEP